MTTISDVIVSPFVAAERRPRAGSAEHSRRNSTRGISDPQHQPLFAQFGDDPERLLAAGDALEIVEGVAPPLPMIVPGRTGAVRAEDRVFAGEELVVGFWRLLDHDVEPCTQDLLV